MQMWIPNESETEESTKCPWVGVVEDTAGGKNRETVTASLCLVFKGRSPNLAPPLIKSINSLFPGEKACQISQRCSRNRFNAVTKLSRINAGRNISCDCKKSDKARKLRCVPCLWR